MTKHIGLGFLLTVSLCGTALAYSYEPEISDLQARVATLERLVSEKLHVPLPNYECVYGEYDFPQRETVYREVRFVHASRSVAENSARVACEKAMAGGHACFPLRKSGYDINGCHTVEAKP